MGLRIYVPDDDFSNPLTDFPRRLRPEPKDWQSGAGRVPGWHLCPFITQHRSLTHSISSYASDWHKAIYENSTKSGPGLAQRLHSIAHKRIIWKGGGNMKKQRNPKTEQTITLRLWTFAGAKKAVPYIRSLVQSLRESWLELRTAQAQDERLKSRPGRPDREALIQRDESDRQLRHATDKLDEIVSEMMVLSVFGVDPAMGLAVLPFFRGDVLAWFVFDLFDPEGLVAWRLHSDGLETRRPLSELEQTPFGAGVTKSPPDGAKV